MLIIIQITLDTRSLRNQRFFKVFSLSLDVGLKSWILFNHLFDALLEIYWVAMGAGSQRFNWVRQLRVWSSFRHDGISKLFLLLFLETSPLFLFKQGEELFLSVPLNLGHECQVLKLLQSHYWVSWHLNVNKTDGLDQSSELRDTVNFCN